MCFIGIKICICDDKEINKEYILIYILNDDCIGFLSLIFI